MHKLLKTLRAVAVSGLLLWLTGCMSLPGGVAPSNTPIEGRKYQVLGRTAATDSWIGLFGFIPIWGSNRISNAMDAAIRKKGGDALIEVTVDCYFQYWILFTRMATRVEGVAIRFER